MNIIANPYKPPKAEDIEPRHKIVSTINGSLIGIGIGLQTCDFLDLTPTDFTALYGWRNGIVFSAALGTIIGYFREDLFACKWIVLLGLMAVFQGETIAFTIFAESPANIYTLSMVSTGLIYVLFGTVMAIKYRRHMAEELKQPDRSQL